MRDVELVCRSLSKLLSLVVVLCVASGFKSSDAFAADGVPVADEAGIQSVVVSGDRKNLILTYSVLAGDEHAVYELQPWMQESHAISQSAVASSLPPGSSRVIQIARFDGARDRIDSRFLMMSSSKPAGAAKSVVSLHSVSEDQEPFPNTSGKKGLQVQMLDDALALGIQHASLNVNVAGMVDIEGRADSFSIELNGARFHFHRGVVRQLDEQVQTLSSAGVHVYLILLNIVHGDDRIDAIMRYPGSPRRPRNQIAAFNMETEQGVAWFRAAIAFLADRYSGSSQSDRNGSDGNGGVGDQENSRGRVVGYITGNEVNSHEYWYAMGSVEPDVVIQHYHRALRLVHAAVRRYSASARVYISLDHFWTGRIGNDPLEAFGGRQLIDRLTELSRREGDFDWHVAHHPYPENLFEPRSWLDKTAEPSENSPRITFRNLEQLTRYLDRPELQYAGAARRVILSEQGFHTPAEPDGQVRQAAGFCYAWIKVQKLSGIDAFILHRHVDHRHEGGLNLGLWTRESDSVATPSEKKLMYEVFRQADSDQWEPAFRFALPVIGIRSWDEISVSADADD